MQVPVFSAQMMGQDTDADFWHVLEEAHREVLLHLSILVSEASLLISRSCLVLLNEVNQPPRCIKCEEATWQCQKHLGFNLHFLQVPQMRLQWEVAKRAGRREGASKGRGYMYTYGWFMLRFDRKQQDSIKQLSFNKKLIKKRSCKDTVKQWGWDRTGRWCAGPSASHRMLGEGRDPSALRLHTTEGSSDVGVCATVLTLGQRRARECLLPPGPSLTHPLRRVRRESSVTSFTWQIHESTC